MKRIYVLLICLFAIIINSINCFALSSDEVKANLITKQGKTGIVKEYSTLSNAIDNSKNGDIIEILNNIDSKVSIDVNKNITLVSGKKRTSNIIIGKSVKLSTESPINIENIILDNNGKDYLVRLKNITLNGEYITETGDINLDNNVNLRDLVSIKKYFATTSEYKICGDLNLDKSCNAEDILVMVKILLGEY